MGAGRPSKYDPEYCGRVVELGRQGKSPAQIAGMLDVCRQTLNNWAEEHPEFLAALTRAKTLEQLWWEDEGQKALTSDKFNSAVWAKSMSARFRDDYTERRELKGDAEAPLTVKIVNYADQAADSSSE